MPISPVVAHGTYGRHSHVWPPGMRAWFWSMLSHTVAFQFCFLLVAPLSAPLGHVAIISADDVTVPPPAPVLPTLTSTEPPPTKPISRPFILSRNSTPVPAKLVAKIASLQFVDMRELLPDNIALAERLAALPQHLQVVRANNPQLDSQREVASIASWSWAFTTYVAIISQAHPNLTISRLAYMRNILREANRLGGSGWRTYDYVFRSQAAVDTTMDWAELNPTLALSYLQHTPNSPHLPRIPCSLCQEPDHVSSSCALAPLATPSQHWPPKKGPPLSPKPLPSKLPDGSQLCVSWNQGLCSAPGPICRYKHVCGSCGEDHQAKGCRLTPEGSIFKRPPKRPPPRAT